MSLRPEMLAALALALGGCTGSCDDPLVQDICDDPAVGSATSLELGTGGDDAFVPVADGDVVPLIYGTQGSAMIPLALRLRGDVPACLAQESAAYTVASGELIDSDSSPRGTYEQTGGERTTRQILLIMRSYLTNPGDAVRIEVTAGGMTAERVVFLEYVGQADAAPPDGAAAADAAIVDAGADAASPDAGADATPADGP
jgi:hypothetical protein